ncbi:DUF5722 domain-containing protein [Rhizohabitans arisaemae]|uniref:DUF5722 domain-containing protein n=1 Tax=Rhizohabitans arisaemae TaxID=2720610 RepID=UPI0024B0A402|nr:DUF5722 domain-containing protein [Rhizohabitans arisaemae]
MLKVPRLAAVFATLCVAALLPLITTPPAAAEPPECPTGISKVAVGKRKIEFSGTATSGCTVVPGRKVEIYAKGSDTPLTTVTPGADGAFRASVKRYSGKADRLNATFTAVGVDGAARTALGGPRHVDTWKARAANSAPRPTPTTQKGLSVSMTSDAEELGIGHAAISVGVNYLIRQGPGDPADTIEFQSGGRTFYFDKSYAEWLDHSIKPLSDNDTLVYLVLVIVYDDKPNSGFPVLVHPDAPTGPPPSFMTYAFNTVTPDGIAHYTALMEFIAQRYSRDDEKYGKAIDYIVGNEINSAGVWQRMGDKTLPQFLDNYVPALRIGHNAARKYHSDGRVYISLDHFWNSAALPSEPLKFYKGKEVLDGLAAKIKAEGDFPWHVAHHPYPSDMMDPRTWNDPVTEDPSTSKITFKNIATLSRYLERPELRHNGEPRRIILSEQGCQSPTNGAADQELQAACFAYSYYKIRAAGGIDAYIWDPQVDNREAAGLRIGLYTWDDKRQDFAAPPGEKKRIYNLFRDIDTADSLALTEFAKPIIGIGDWTEAIPNFTPAMIDRRRTATQVPAYDYAALGGSQQISGFESGVNGWRTSDHTHAIESVADPQAPQGTKVLRTHFTDKEIVFSNGTNSKAWRGVDLPLTTPLNATAKPNLAVKLRVPGTGTFSPVNKFSAQIRAYGADGTVAYGTAAIKAGTDWNSVGIDLSGWAGRSQINRIKVWVKGSSGDDWKGTFDLDAVTLAATADATGRPANLDLRARADDRKGAGSTVRVDVVNNGGPALAADLAVQDCDGVTLNGPVAVTGLVGSGGRKTVTGTFASYTPADPDHPKLCLTLGGHVYTVTVEVPPPPPTLLYDFENGTQGWKAGENVNTVARVSSFPNGPQRPHGGEGALDAVLTDGDASRPKTVSVRPAGPLRLGGVSEVYAWVNAYGGIPDATGYEAKLTLRSGSESISTVLPTFVPDKWNRLAIDVSAWPHRNNVTGIDVTYRALGTTFNWVGGPHLQVDDVGVVGNYDQTATWRAAWGASIGGHFGGDSPADTTYRQSLRLSTGGDAVRVRLVNPFSSAPLVFDHATVGVRESGAAVRGTPTPLTVDGKAKITVPPGEIVYTDPVTLAVGAGDNLLVSTHALSSLPLLSHDWANKTQYRTAAGAGDRTGDQGGTSFTATGTSTYWIDAVDVLGSQVPGTVVVLGDSITDGAGATRDGDDRWTDVLSGRLNALPAADPRRRAVVNAGIGGNTLNSIGNPQVGVNGLTRLDRDVLKQTGVTDVVVFMGTNDIYTGSTSSQVISALTTAAERIHAADLRAIVATAIPRGNGTGWTAAHETQRQALNAWIRSNRVFDAVIDFDPLVADPADPTKIRAAYDADGTHPNAAGYGVMGNGVNLDVFTAPRRQPVVVTGFEDGAPGWTAGTNVAGVSTVSSFPNGPHVPYRGQFALQAVMTDGDASRPKSVVYTPQTPIDMSGAAEVSVWFDGYGGIPDATGYEVELTVWSDQDKVSGTIRGTLHDQWSKVATDISQWSGRNRVTKIEVTYRILGTTWNWCCGALFQLDELQYS